MDEPTSKPGAEIRHILELTEAHTALALYLGAIKHMIEENSAGSDELLQMVLGACISQSERAHEALKQLRQILIR